MPLLRVYSVLPEIPPGLGSAIADVVSSALSIPSEKVWTVWLPVKRTNIYRPGIDQLRINSAPIVLMHCRLVYDQHSVSEALRGLRDLLSAALSCDRDAIFVISDRVSEGNLLSFGEVWEPSDEH